MSVFILIMKLTGRLDRIDIAYKEIERNKIKTIMKNTTFLRMTTNMIIYQIVIKEEIETTFGV